MIGKSAKSKIGAIGSNLQDFYKSSYSKKPQNVDGYNIDKNLSGKRVQVYHNPTTNQAVVVHRGTQGLKDIGTDLYYSLGGNVNQTDRFKHAQKIQNQAQSNYGANNTTTLGHSLGAKVASTVGQNSKQIINYNKAVSPLDALKKTSGKEINIRTSNDPVSALLPKNKNTIIIPSKTNNPLIEHSTNALSRLKFH
jgi:hypothetical protein